MPGETVRELRAGDEVAGRYVIRRELGKGGFGAVYEAEHKDLRRSVAIKVLLPELG